MPWGTKIRNNKMTRCIQCDKPEPKEGWYEVEEHTKRITFWGDMGFIPDHLFNVYFCSKECYENPNPIPLFSRSGMAKLKKELTDG